MALKPRPVTLQYTPRSRSGAGAAAPGLCCVCRVAPGSDALHETALVCVRTDCRRQLQDRLSAAAMLKKCSYCQLPLEPAQSHWDRCDEPGCEATWLQRQSTSAFEEETRSLALGFQEIREGLDARGHPNVALIRIPHAGGKMVPREEERVARFGARLWQLAALATSESGELRQNETAAPPADAPAEPTAHLVAAACGTCSGFCCRQGKDHAFLTADNIRERLQTEGLASIEDVIRFYLDRIPMQTREGSCIYHTDRGCALPRDWRSLTCNSYLCHGLTYDATPAAEQGLELVFVSCEYDEVKRVSDPVPPNPPAAGPSKR